MKLMSCLLVVMSIAVVGCSQNVDPQKIKATLDPIQEFARAVGASGQVKVTWRADARFGMLEQFVMESPGTQVTLDLTVDPTKAQALEKAFTGSE